MLHKRLQLSPSIRMAMAFGLFGILVAIGMLAVYRLPQYNGKKTLNKTSAAATEDPYEESFFYQSIGHAGPAFDDTQPTAPATAQTKEKTLYTLEFKVSDRREDAESLVATLHEQGIDAYYTPLSQTGRVVYRVRQGMFHNSDSAKSAALALRQQRNLSATIVKLQ